jgi:hypothetical protein
VRLGSVGDRGDAWCVSSSAVSLRKDHADDRSGSSGAVRQHYSHPRSVERNCTLAFSSSGRSIPMTVMDEAPTRNGSVVHSQRTASPDAAITPAASPTATPGATGARSSGVFPGQRPERPARRGSQVFRSHLLRVTVPAEVESGWDAGGFEVGVSCHSSCRVCRPRRRRPGLFYTRVPRRKAAAKSSPQQQQ